MFENAKDLADHRVFARFSALLARRGSFSCCTVNISPPLKIKVCVKIDF